MTTTTETFLRLGIREVMPSQSNPRKHYDEGALADLEASIALHGILEPLIVRDLGEKKKGTRYELVAGERRYRAAVRVAAGKPEELRDVALPCIVREYSDEQVLEIQLIENSHRDGLTPLEQAGGFRRLIDTNPDRHSAESIARRLGMSVDYVWDVLSLNQLSADAKALLEEGRILKGHAVIIARQKPEDQAWIIRPPTRSYPRVDSGLWEFDEGRLDLDPGEKKGKYGGLKARSVRELQSWVEDHIRFDVAHAAKAQPIQFEATAADVQAAVEEPGRGKKLIAITYDYRVTADARDDKERTYGRDAWVRADGEKKSRTCEYSVLGVVIAGKGQGETLRVCVARDRCEVHFGQVIKERAKNQRLRESGKGQRAAARETAAAVREQKAREREAVREQHWEALGRAIEKAGADKVQGLKKITPALLGHALKHLRLPVVAEPRLARMIVTAAFKQTEFRWLQGERKAREWAKLLGVDVKGIEKSLAPAPEPEVAEA